MDITYMMHDTGNANHYSNFANILFMGEQKAEIRNLVQKLFQVGVAQFKTFDDADLGIYHETNFMPSDGQQYPFSIYELGLRLDGHQLDSLKSRCEHNTNLLCFVIDHSYPEIFEKLGKQINMFLESHVIFSKIFVLDNISEKFSNDTQFQDDLNFFKKNYKSIKFLNVTAEDENSVEYLLLMVMEVMRSLKQETSFDASVSSTTARNKICFINGRRKQKVFKIVKIQKATKRLGSKRRDKEILSKLKRDSCDNSVCDDHESENTSNPNSLISISKEVLKFLKEKVKSKGTNVTHFILSQLNLDQSDKSFKNIQRRVYDAINVMSAVGILDKDKNNLHFKGSHSFENSKISAKLIKQVTDSIKLKTQEINQRQYELLALASKFYLSISLVNSNSRDPKRKNTMDKLTYPFTLIKQVSEASFIIKQDEDNNRLCILSDRMLDIISEEQIMKDLLKNDVGGIMAGLKVNIDPATYAYIDKYQLIYKYFQNYSNFNTNSTTLKEGYNTFAKYKQSTDEPFSLINDKYTLGSETRKDMLNDLCNDDIQMDNYSYYHNDRFHDMMDDGTNNMSTNFFSKFLK